MGTDRKHSDQDYATINFEIGDSAATGDDAPTHQDTLRESFRKKSNNLRGSLLLNVVMLIIIIILSAILHDAKDQSDDGNASADGTSACLYGDCLREQCSGNGIFDSLLNKCACFECFSGDICADDASSSAEECLTIDVSAGDPLLFQSYWLETDPSSEAMMEVDPTWGMSYRSLDAESVVKDDIRRLHKLVGNADVRDSDFIVLGSGSTHLLSAVLYAVGHWMAQAAGNTGSPPNVYAEIPYYDAYAAIATYHDSRLLGEFNPAASPGLNDSVIEIVTSPNNPDGDARLPRYDQSFRLMDRAYNWPHYVPMQTTALSVGDMEVELYTLSKVTGHAGTRLGWVVVKDETLALLIQKYIAVSVVAIPHETIWRAHRLLSHVLESDGVIFSYAKNEMRHRWSTMTNLFETVQTNGRFSLYPEYSSANAEMCSFFNHETIPTLAYAWIKCNFAADTSSYVSSADSSRVGCDGVFYDAGINGRPGRAYGMQDDSYVRLEMLMNSRTFALLVRRLQTLLFTISPSLQQ